jgi:hypothetical protein
MNNEASLRSDGPVVAAGLWKAADGYEAQQERSRPLLPTSPWKTGEQTPVSHSAHSPRHQNHTMKSKLVRFDHLNGRS